MGDKMAREIENLTSQCKEQGIQLNDLKDHYDKLLKDRDQYRLDTQMLDKEKKKIEKQYNFDKTTSKEREVKLNKQLALLNKEKHVHEDEIVNLQRTCKQLAMDKEKSKLRIQKLISRKGKFDGGLQTCKKCGKEYNEKENYNWSCRTHQSDYSGEMWWCCGKTGKETPGCKYGAHESKDDDEDEEETTDLTQN